MTVNRGGYLFGKMEPVTDLSQANADSTLLNLEITTVDMILATVVIWFKEDFGDNSVHTLTIKFYYMFQSYVLISQSWQGITRKISSIFLST